MRWMQAGASRMILPGAVALSVVAAACGGGEGQTEAGAAAQGLEGSIAISGSSTVEPISAANAQKFATSNPGVQISVDGPGTGDGFELFCQGEIDISDASRPIEQEEVAACKEAGVEFVELKVGIDGLSVITSVENDRVECLDFKDLYALLGPESKGFENWSEANDLGEEIGAGNAPYPDAPLEVTAPGQESGTYDSFAEIVMEDFAVEERKQPEDGPFIRPDYQASPDDNVILEGVGGSSSSLGWVGFAFAEGAGESIREIPVAEEGSDCVQPNAETIASGEYPIARDLYIYVNKASAEENETLRAFVDFYLSDQGFASVQEVGYVGLPDDAKQETSDVWKAMETGTRDGG